jgi:crotonobetainyl-CoA:carnitine CoA-transferase CaiB-like acyl-CoA transferase
MIKPENAGVLSNLRVIEMGTEIGAWCGKLLADMGANVIKIESLLGDRSRAYEPFYQDNQSAENSLFWWHYNTNKQSVTIDIESKQGQDLVRKLASKCDVILDSYEPGYLDRLGLGYDQLKEENESIIVAAVSFFGKNMPYSSYAMTDLTAIAFGGPAWSCGYDDHSIAPVRGGGNQGYQTACHFAMIAIMAALVYRSESGVGQFIDVNMHAALNVTTESGSYNYLVNGESVQRQTGRHAGIRPSPGTQIMGPGGRYINVGFPARTEEQWFTLLAWLEEEGVLGDLGDYLSPPNRQSLQIGDQKATEQLTKVMEAISSMAADKDPFELFCEAQNRGLQWGIVNAPEDVINDPHFNARGFIVSVEHPEIDSSFRYPGAPYRFEKGQWSIRRRAPLLGEDTKSVLMDDLNLTELEYQKLSWEGVI